MFKNGFMSTDRAFHFVDSSHRLAFLPFAYIRPLAHLYIGMDTLAEKWQHFISEEFHFSTEPYLAKKYPSAASKNNVLINPLFVPTQALAEAIQQLDHGEGIVYQDNWIACCTDALAFPPDPQEMNITVWEEALIFLQDKTDLFLKNNAVLLEDFNRLTAGKKSQKISSTNQVIAAENIFLAPGAKVECSVLNASDGPIYIGKNAEVMEGSLIRGSFFLGDNAVVKMGAKIYGGTSIATYSKVGGELSNVNLFPYSNKGHDGFLGNAVIGSWCNIGAATDASNLKNNYDKLRVWDYATEGFKKTDLQFCGLLMGDYSRCGIHSMFNTATVIGVNVNAFGAGFPRTFIPSFTYGGAQGMTTYQFNKAMTANNAMMKRRDLALEETDHTLLAEVFDISSKWRKA